MLRPCWPKFADSGLCESAKEMAAMSIRQINPNSLFSSAYR